MPDNTFYTQVKPEDADEIVKEHVIGGRRVERLLYVDPKTQEHVSDSKHMDFYRKQKRVALRNCGFIDPENIAEMTPAEVLEFLFGESSEFTATDALSIVLQNTDYTEDELTSNDLITESGETFHALSFYRNGTYVFYVRDKDGTFFTSDDFNKAYNEDYDGYIGHDW